MTFDPNALLPTSETLQPFEPITEDEFDERFPVCDAAPYEHELSLRLVPAADFFRLYPKQHAEHRDAVHDLRKQVPWRPEWDEVDDVSHIRIRTLYAVGECSACGASMSRPLVRVELTLPDGLRISRDYGAR